MFLKMPRWKKENPILHGQLNRLAEGVERADAIDVDTSMGLTLTDRPTGKTIGLTLRPTASYAVVSSGGISAASGMTLGRGLIDRCYKDDSGTLQLYGGPSEDVYNSTAATASKGDIVQVKWIDEDWAWDVASCPAS